MANARSWRTRLSLYRKRNLVCPSSYDLGEHIRVVLLSVTEGEDKPLKYPSLFNSADAAIITKIDIAEPCAFDRGLAIRNIHEIRPGIDIFETSAKTGQTMHVSLDYLTALRNLKPPVSLPDAGHFQYGTYLLVRDLLRYLHDRLHGVAGHDPVCRSGNDSFILEPEI